MDIYLIHSFVTMSIKILRLYMSVKLSQMKRPNKLSQFYFLDNFKVICNVTNLEPLKILFLPVGNGRQTVRRNGEGNFTDGEKTGLTKDW